MKLTVKTEKPKQVLDITRLINLEAETQKIQEGLCVLFVKHTTAALTTADLDPGTDLDMLDAFDQLIPQLNYRHPHNPDHVKDHIVSSMIGPSLIVPIINGEVSLGAWQRIVLVELDGPRNREIVIAFIKDLL